MVTSTKPKVSASAIEEPVVTKIAINVIGAKAMHKVLKESSNEATSLLFVSETPDQDTTVSNDSDPEVNPAMKVLVNQFQRLGAVGRTQEWRTELEDCTQD